MIETIQTADLKAKAIEKEYKWLLHPVHTAFETIAQSPFFNWLDQLSSPLEFAPAAKQIFFHSNTFPKAIGLMLSAIPSNRGELYKTIAEHAFDESDHHLLLLEWMIRHQICESKDHVFMTGPTIETNNCINLGYQIAVERDIDMWLVCINCAIEYCFYNFFKVVSPKMHSLRAGHFYFDTHVEADQYHSVMGLQFLSNTNYSQSDKEKLITQSLNAISLWCAMAHSWINQSYFPKFDLNGQVK